MTDKHYNITIDGVSWSTEGNPDAGPSLAGPPDFMARAIPALREALHDTQWSLEVFVLDRPQDDEFWQPKLQSARAHNIVRCYVASDEVLLADPILRCYLLPDALRERIEGR